MSSKGDACCRKDKGDRQGREGLPQSRGQASTNGGSKEGRPPRPAGGPRGRQADAAALAAAAASLNTFKGDGSFMDSFQQASGKLQPLLETPYRDKLAVKA